MEEHWTMQSQVSEKKEDSEVHTVLDLAAR